MMFNLWNVRSSEMDMDRKENVTCFIPLETFYQMRYMMMTGSIKI